MSVYRLKPCEHQQPERRKRSAQREHSVTPIASLHQEVVRFCCYEDWVLYPDELDEPTYEFHSEGPSREMARSQDQKLSFLLQNPPGSLADEKELQPRINDGSSIPPLHYSQSKGAQIGMKECLVTPKVPKRPSPQRLTTPELNDVNVSEFSPPKWEPANQARKFQVQGH